MLDLPTGSQEVSANQVEVKAQFYSTIPEGRIRFTAPILAEKCPMLHMEKLALNKWLCLKWAG